VDPLQALWIPFDFSKKCFAPTLQQRQCFGHLTNSVSSAKNQSDEQTMAGTDEGKNAEKMGAFNMTGKLPTHFESNISAKSLLKKSSKFNHEYCRRTFSMELFFTVRRTLARRTTLRAVYAIRLL